MTLLVPERQPLPSIEALHVVLCSHYLLEHKASALKDDFRHNSYAISILLAPMVSPFAISTYGIYHGGSIALPGCTEHEHAWVSCLGRVIDPCRWLFTGGVPEIFEGDVTGPDYAYRERTSPKPTIENVPWRPAGLVPASLISFQWPPAVAAFLREQVFQDNRDVSGLTLSELTFLAQLSHTDILLHLHGIYAAIINAGYESLINDESRAYYGYSLDEVTPSAKRSLC